MQLPTTSEIQDILCPKLDFLPLLKEFPKAAETGQQVRQQCDDG